MTDKIHMGHGQMVSVLKVAAGEWELVFSEEGIAEYKAPPIEEVQVDLIDVNGKLSPATISAGKDVSTVKATAQTQDASRIRIRVLHGTHFHTREGQIAGAQAPVAVKGPNGGAVASFDGGLAIEIKSVDPETWELFFTKEGAAIDPVSVDDVTVQAVGPRAEDFQFRNLKGQVSSSGKSLLVAGKIKDAVFAHIVLKGETTAARSVPL